MISASVSLYDQAVLSRLWQTLSSDGLPPYKAIEQLSYLLVLKKRAMCEQGGAPSLPWSALQSIPEEHFMNAVSETVAWLRESSGIPLFEKAQLSISKPGLLRTAMELINELFSPTHSGERYAFLYDVFLSMAEEAARTWASPGVNSTRLIIWRICCAHWFVHRRVSGSEIMPVEMGGCWPQPMHRSCEPTWQTRT